MSRDEIFALDLDGVEARSAELSAEMTEDGNLEAFESEIAMLEERKGQILEERAAQKAATEAVINGEGETIKETIIEEKRTMTDMEIRNSDAYINAFAEYIKSGDDTECRALLTTNASGVVPVREKHGHGLFYPVRAVPVLRADGGLEGLLCGRDGRQGEHSDL